MCIYIYIYVLYMYTHKPIHIDMHIRKCTYLHVYKYHVFLYM